MKFSIQTGNVIRWDFTAPFSAAAAVAAKEATEAVRDEVVNLKSETDTFKDLSRSYAINPEDEEVVPGEYSSFHFMKKVEALLAGVGVVNGREIELQKTATHIQWRYVGEATWLNLIPLTDIEGPQGLPGANGSDGDDGREIELQKTATHIQWRYIGEVTWLNLIPLTDIEGPQGPTGPQGIQGPVGSIPSAEESVVVSLMPPNAGLFYGKDIAAPITGQAFTAGVAPLQYVYPITLNTSTFDEIAVIATIQGRAGAGGYAYIGFLIDNSNGLLFEIRDQRLIVLEIVSGVATEILNQNSPGLRNGYGTYEIHTGPRGSFGDTMYIKTPHSGSFSLNKATDIGALTAIGFGEASAGVKFTGYRVDGGLIQSIP